MIVTKSVHPAVLEIMGPRHIGVTTLAFQLRDVIDHVTIRFAVFYWRSVGAEPLSPTFLETFGPTVNEPTNKHDGSQYLPAEMIKILVFEDNSTYSCLLR